MREAQMNQRELVSSLAHERGLSPDSIQVVVSPYRVCPLGAHLDHQGGPVLGMAIAAQTLLAFAPTDDGRIRLDSGNFDGEVSFEWAEAGEDEGPSWGLYARGAADALRDALPAAPRGLVGRVVGTLPGGGLSSSASIILALLRALAATNDLELSDPEWVSLSRRVENERIGVASGILDPASIVGARRGELLAIDTRAGTWESIPLGAGTEMPRVLVAFSGTERSLAQTGFNSRVDECLAAARSLAALAGDRGPSPTLGDFEDAEFDAHAAALPETLRRRASHFFSERDRVRRGALDWKRGDLESLGERMKASCNSSLTQYETGSPELASLQQILEETPGVYGSRFSGGGFGGCAIAFVRAEHAEAAAERVLGEYLAACPEQAGRARVFAIDSNDGLRLA